MTRIVHVTHIVYEAVAADGKVLYVGTTMNINERLNAHRFTAPWWGDMAHCRITVCRNRIESLDLEAELIAQHHPAHNIQGNPNLPTQERGTVITAVLHLLRANGPMTTTEVRLGLGDGRNASSVLRKLHAEGIVRIIERVPSHGNARWMSRWELTSDGEVAS